MAVMTDINTYLTGEVVVDYADGLIPRREALRRLALLGVGAGTAMSMLAACDAGGTANGGGTPAGRPTGTAGAGPAGPPARPTEAITFAGPAGRTLQGAWAAAPDTPRGSVLVI